jgi:hypothetical protein
MATAMACPGVETERVRSRGWRRASESRERGETPARSTATFTVAVDDLPDALRLSDDGFASATWRRGPAGEREWIGSKWAREEVSRGGLRFYYAGWGRSRVHRRWTPLGIVGGFVRRHCALSLGNR